MRQWSKDLGYHSLVVCYSSGLYLGSLAWLIVALLFIVYPTVFLLYPAGSFFRMSDSVLQRSVLSTSCGKTLHEFIRLFPLASEVCRGLRFLGRNIWQREEEKQYPMGRKERKKEVSFLSCTEGYSDCKSSARDRS